MKSESQKLVGCLLEKFPNFDPGWAEELQMKWLDTFAEFSRLILSPVIVAPIEEQAKRVHQRITPDGKYIIHE